MQPFLYPCVILFVTFYDEISRLKDSFCFFIQVELLIDYWYIFVLHFSYELTCLLCSRTRYVDI